MQSFFGLLWAVVKYSLTVWQQLPLAKSVKITNDSSSMQITFIPFGEILETLGYLE